MSSARIWREPVRGGYPEPWLLSLPGRERLERWRLAQAPTPPLFHLTGARPTGVGDGTADAEMPATGWLTNSAGLIGGGTLAILADIAFGCSVETRVPAATPYTTAELSLTFVRPARPGGMLSAHGQAIHVGRRVGVSEVFVADAAKTLIAHGTSRLSILRAIDGLPEPPDPPPAFELPQFEAPDPYLREPPEATLPDEAWTALTGLEIVRRQIAGELPAPPIHALTGMAPTEVSDGRATAVMPASEWLNSPANRLQGGAITMLADFTMLIAALTTAPAGVAVAGLDLKVNFLRPVSGDGRELTAHARVEHSGRTLAITRARVDNADGKPVMLATSSAMYLPGHSARLEETGELSAADARQ
ncbi:MAG TPA: PaaI family thioesterase [Solirubrobacterales bacterium]|nr:PaaI family thioesterase [Solirubrobacterales bacterium]